jgi:hypothetical protein
VKPSSNGCKRCEVRGGRHNFIRCFLAFSVTYILHVYVCNVCQELITLAIEEWASHILQNPFTPNQSGHRQRQTCWCPIQLCSDILPWPDQRWRSVSANSFIRVYVIIVIRLSLSLSVESTSTSHFPFKLITLLCLCCRTIMAVSSTLTSLCGCELIFDLELPLSPRWVGGNMRSTDAKKTSHFERLYLRN